MRFFFPFYLWFYGSLGTLISRARLVKQNGSVLGVLFFKNVFLRFFMAQFLFSRSLLIYFLLVCFFHKRLLSKTKYFCDPFPSSHPVSDPRSSTSIECRWASLRSIRGTFRPTPRSTARSRGCISANTVSSTCASSRPTGEKVVARMRHDTKAEEVR